MLKVFVTLKADLAELGIKVQNLLPLCAEFNHYVREDSVRLSFEFLGPELKELVQLKNLLFEIVAKLTFSCL